MIYPIKLWVIWVVCPKKRNFIPTKSWYIPQKTMAIFATMVSLRNWVGGEIVQARGKPRGTKTLRWVFLKERTMKPHHKMFFFPFVSARVGFFQHGFCRVN